ncbi:hypothetical protein, partial [Bacillus toyonensis]|uniref:hypothetical protein n=2 Tax=Bacillus cereus group TaxID=86661 RepID=UPI00027BFD35
VTQQTSRPTGRTVAASRANTTGARPAVTQQASRPTGRTVAASRANTTGARPAVTQQTSRPTGRNNAATRAASRISTTGARPAVTQQVSRPTGRNNVATRAASRISTTGEKPAITQVSRSAGKIVNTPRMNDVRVQKPTVVNRTIAAQPQQINTAGGMKVNNQKKNQATDLVTSRPSILSRNEKNNVNSVSPTNNSTKKRGDKK